MNFLLITKKPPLIQPSSIFDFSLKTLTLLPLILIAPNLAGGLTVVKVAILPSCNKSKQLFN